MGDVLVDFERMALGRQRRGAKEEEVRWTDMGLVAFLKAVSNLDSTRIKIGIVGERADQVTSHDTQLSLGELALILEYGTHTIPARPFINGVIHPITALIESSRVGRAVVKGQSPDQRLREAGEKFALQLRNNVLTNSKLAGNADSTVRRKGFNHPLFDTGQLVEAIWYELVHDTQGEDLGGAANVESET